METFNCQYCEISCKNKYILDSHLKKSKKCLSIRGLELDEKDKFICKGCDSVFSNNKNLNVHTNSCKEFAINKLSNELKEKYEKELLEQQTKYEKELLDQQNKYEKELDKSVRLLEKQLDMQQNSVRLLEKQLESSLDQQMKIEYLTKKYVKSKPRIQYKETNVIYILTTSSHKKERRYILGKAGNLTNRLSTYNKLFITRNV